MGQAVVHPSLLSLAGCCRSSCTHPLSPLLVAPRSADPMHCVGDPSSACGQTGELERSEQPQPPRGKAELGPQAGHVEAVRLKGAQEVGFVFWMD